MRCSPFHAPLFAGLLGSVLAAAALAQGRGWSGNFAKNPGFEEDFVNSRAEARALFKAIGFTTRDLSPTTDFQGDYAWAADKPHGGGHY